MYGFPTSKKELLAFGQLLKALKYPNKLNGILPRILTAFSYLQFDIYLKTLNLK